jgi:hypothetical protein
MWPRTIINNMQTLITTLMFLAMISHNAILFTIRLTKNIQLDFMLIFVKNPAKF